MRLSWNEIRARAASFARKWADARYEKGETQSFYNDFFRIFGVRRESVARYEEHVQKLDDTSGFIDLFWPGVLIVEQKSAGRDLEAAYEQAGGYFDALAERDKPRFILVSDFQRFELHDLLQRDVVSFRLDQLPNHIEKFGFILGVASRTFRDQDPANIEAAELVGKLHDSLRDTGYARHDLERFLVRIVFCLFADDTGVFEPRDLLLDFVETRTREDGTDLGPLLMRLFQVLDTPEGERGAALDEDLARFPHVDGDLFADRISIPDFTATMREQLLAACRFNWSSISPAIFGSLFQFVMDPAESRAQGAHYTTEANILKVIQPLFLDELWDEFARIRALRRGRATQLRAFQDRLGELTFFDPACGCGNFLVIAYRELRRLELEVLRELLRRGERRVLQFDVSSLSRLDVDRFYGIEIGEFPARIAEVALWMMDHLMNNELSLEFGEAYARIPLRRSPHIHCRDALEMNWEDVLSAKNCSFILGNPPFGGFVWRDAPKQRQTRTLMAELGATGSRLDYVAAWFLKAGGYFKGGRARIGFVATSSITQGEQAPQLWPALFSRYGLEIAFAHRTFAWQSEARGMAHVHVVIVGLADRAAAPPVRRLFSYDDPKGDPHESAHAALSPYLFDAGGLQNPHLVVQRERSSSGGFPRIGVGSKPVDGGHYVLDATERANLLAMEPGARTMVRPFIGGREHINRLERWILYPAGESPAKLRVLPGVMGRIRAVRNYRATEAGKLGQSLADRPTEFHVTVVPTRDFLVIPEVSSERRRYVPIGYLSPPAIPSNQLLVVEDATLGLFGLLTSAMHMAWLRNIGGRLKSDYRYSSGLVYNPFPPPPGGADLSTLDPLAEAVLDARAAYPEATLADLYDPDLMPPDLRRTHATLDRAVDRLYRPRKFPSERERVEHLFALYERMRAPLTASAKKKTRRKRTRRVRS